MNKFVLIISVLVFLFESGSGQDFQIKWQQCLGGTESEECWDLYALSNTYILTGNTMSNNGDISFNHGGADVWLVKIDETGNVDWEKTYGGSSGEGAYKVFPADNGSFYVLGSGDSSDGDISNDPYPGSTDFWILKVDSIGNILWEKILGGNMLDQMWTGTSTNDGGVVAFGWTGSDDGDISIAYGGYDMWMVKLTSEGEKEWDFSIGTDNLDFGQAIRQTSDGGFLVGGSSQIGEGGNLICTPHSWASEAILVKLDANLNIEWQQCYGGSGHDGVSAIEEIIDGYVFTAYVNSNDGDIAGWHGQSDIWVVKIDLWGNIIWQKCLGGSRSEYTSKLTITDEDEIIIYGNTQSNNGDVTGNHSISEHDHDIWVVKLNNEGDLLGEQCFGGIFDERVNYGILKKGDNNFIIAGQTDFGPSFDVQCTPHSLGTPDFWVFEIMDTTTNTINYSEKDNGLKVYPNPAKDYIVFEIQDTRIKNQKIIITNTFGQQVALLPVEGETIVWDTRDLQSGIYFYTLESEGIKYNGKVVIQK